MSITSAMDIPLVDLKRQHRPLEQSIAESIQTILHGMNLLLGPNVRAFEQEFARYLDVPHCIGVSDGTMALHLALRACGVGPGDEVIIPSHTFFATVEAIVLAGATPIFVEVDPRTYCLDIAATEAAIGPRTRALLPVHLYGRLAEMETLLALARRRGLLVIEDACQAHGARNSSGAAGALGDVGCFSFYYSKNLGAYGEAGALVTRDPTIARTARRLRDHGSEARYHHDQMGVNGRLDEIQAAILRIKLPFLDGWNEARRGLAEQYNAGLADLPVETPDIPGVDHVFHLYVIRTSRRDALRSHLQARGIQTGIHYPIPCHLQPACSSFSDGPGSLPLTETLANDVLSLPLFPELEQSEQRYVIHSIVEFFDGTD